MVLCHICPFVFRLFEGTPRHSKIKRTDGDICATYHCFIFLRRSFPSFCGTRYRVSRLVLPQKFTSSAAAGAARKAVALPKVRSPKSAVFGGGILHLPGCSVTLPLHKFRSFGKCARRILEVRSPKSAVFGGGILHLPGCSVTLPLRVFRSLGKCARRILEVTLGKSVILPRFITFYENQALQRD